MPREEKEVPSVQIQKASEDCDDPDKDFDDDTPLQSGIVETNEKVMIHQPFLFDEDRLVREVLLEVGINVLYFVRYEVGQEVQ